MAGAGARRGPQGRRRGGGPGAPRGRGGVGRGCSPLLLVAVGIWRRGRAPLRGGEAAGAAVAARARRRAAHGRWPRRALCPPPAAPPGRTDRGSSSARRIQARKSGSLTEPAFPLTQPQPRLIRSTEGKEAN